MKIKEEVVTTLPSIVESLDFNIPFEITFRYRDEVYHYTNNARWKHFECPGDREALLVSVYGPNYRRHVDRLYGIRSKGWFPEWTSTDQIVRLLLDMESKGVIIS